MGLRQEERSLHLIATLDSGPPLTSISTGTYSLSLLQIECTMRALPLSAHVVAYQSAVACSLPLLMHWVV